MDHVAAARAWTLEDPDPATRAQLVQLIDRAAVDPAAAAELADCFAGRLQFGTAGLRGALGPGPNRMNQAVVRRAAAGLARYLSERVPGAAEAGVVIGCDARHQSDVFALDTARVMAAAGIRALRLPPRLPTPLLAFAVRHLGAAAGVMVTASHNPPADNGYKVYLGDGAQIVPPADHDISAAIDAVGPLSGVALSPVDDARIEQLGDEVVDAYLAGALAASLAPRARDVRIVYTAMHGVGWSVVQRLFARAGFPPLHEVVQQVQPDPDFPTVTFPNPEEPGALDLSLALARDVGADVVLANDPDADRLGVAVPDPSAAGGWRALRGDEIGWLLADHVLSHTSGDDRLVVTTVVSSTLLGKMAAVAGVHYAETLTGFKWIARAALDRPGTRFVFGYEQALGYLVGDLVRDKDGITAALAMAEVAAEAKAAGVTLLDLLDGLAARFGHHVTAERSVRILPAEALATMDSLRAAPPSELGGRAVTSVVDRRDGNLLILNLGDGARLLVRPSGTEPKVKVYAEAVDADPTPFLDALVTRLTDR